MFQLIVAVIAIALVIALTLASIFYGGEAFTRSSLKANVAALVNQAQQISGAHTLYKTDFAVPAPSLDELHNAGYLAAVPVAPKIVKQTAGVSDSWQYLPNATATKGYVTIVLGASADETCDAIEKNGVGACTDSSFNGVAASAASDNTTQFSFPL
jgi:hypothetical protein